MNDPTIAMVVVELVVVVVEVAVSVVELIEVDDVVDAEPLHALAPAPPVIARQTREVAMAFD